MAEGAEGAGWALGRGYPLLSGGGAGEEAVPLPEIFLSGNGAFWALVLMLV